MAPPGCKAGWDGASPTMHNLRMVQAESSAQKTVYFSSYSNFDKEAFEWGIVALTGRIEFRMAFTNGDFSIYATNRMLLRNLQDIVLGSSANLTRLDACRCIGHALEHRSHLHERAESGSGVCYSHESLHHYIPKS